MQNQFISTEPKVRDSLEVDNKTPELSNPRVTFNGSRKRWQNFELGVNNEAFEDNESNEKQQKDDNGWSDEEFETTPNLNSSRKSFEASTKSWDSFVTVPPPEEDETLSSEWMDAFIRCFKVLTYTITFTLVLVCAVLSKSLLLLMTSMIKQNQTVTLCTEPFDDWAHGKSFNATYKNDDPERIAWIWSLLFVLIAPVIVTFYKCANTCIFRKYQTPQLVTLFTVFIIESLNTIGLVLLAFMILPSLDSTLGAMVSNSICLIPSILTPISRINNDTTRNTKILLIDLLPIIIQITSIVMWAFIAYRYHASYSFAIPIILVFISLGYWENYFFLNNCKHPYKVFRFLFRIKQDLNRSRYFTFVLISIWKIILIFVTMIIYFYISEGSQLVYSLFHLFEQAFSQHEINILRDFHIQESHQITSKPSNILWILFMQIIFTLVCYKSAKFACKICIQLFSFTLPLTIVGPVSIVFVNTLCRLRIRDRCAVTQLFQPFEYIFWYYELQLNDEWSTIDCLKSMTWILSLLSQIWITFHIWKPCSERLAKTENLFMRPSFCSVFIDQSLMLNRKFDSENTKINENSSRKPSGDLTEQNDEEIVRIYACATMWHETSEEMIQMLKSVIRMDEDQCARRQAKKWFHVDSKHIDYYEIETHILFDDAFEDDTQNGKTGRVVNRFVKQLIEVMDYAASSVHECRIHLKSPTMTWTPYGGRLVWTLPGQNKLYVHLKDKGLIRHRKRWSQVMYMYYLLGYRLKDMDQERRDRIGENTFILALDGDINFRPNAVRLLVDLMKKHKNLGAACGRIHPIGSGPMVWYQMFEYAISHWLQKAAEHVFGCVLCSPGCFSLFRAKALMSPSVMNKYATKPSEAIHYIQYDQGEDRWLCTLLLQQGWRVEYCAASDAYTHCPEVFSEFYTQRRRWGPSTMANIMDLLIDYKRTVKVNENLSTLYILYQSALMVGTILSPGTIFLMVVGAMSTSFGLSSQLCLLYSGAPILLFIVVCFVAKNETQISFSLVLSTVYALIMLAVLVSTLIEIITYGLWQPTSVFFISLCFSFLIAAIIHPTEFVCFFPFILYMLCIPSMYLLLTIYSIINLNVVSWGTREVAVESTHEKQQMLQGQQKPENTFLKFFHNHDHIGENNKSRFICCICCSDPASNHDNVVLMEIKNQLNDFNTILQSLDSTINDKDSIDMNRGFRPNPILSEHSPTHLDVVFRESEVRSLDNSTKTLSNDQSSSADEFSLENDRPFWTLDQELKSFPTQQLDPRELEFWKDFIHLYLLPLDKDPKHEEKAANDLKDLRNRFAFTFGILNSLFILLVLLLQMHKNIFNISFGFGKENVTQVYNEELMTYEYIVEKSDRVQSDIIGLVLVVFFGIILLIQFVGMLLHRFNTLSHLLAFVELNFCKSTRNLANIQQVINENAVNYAKRLQKLNSIEKSPRKSLPSDGSHQQIAKGLSSNIPEFTRLEDAFLKRCLSLKDNFEDEEILPETKLSRNRNYRTISGTDVRRRLYLEVSQETIRRKSKAVTNPYSN